MYSPSSIMMENREYFFPEEITERSPTAAEEKLINDKINKELQSNYIELHQKSRSRTPRDRTISSTSSGLGSIEGDPYRESLLRGVSVHSSIPEDNAVSYV